MLPAEQAVVAALSAEGKAAVKALLLDLVDKEIPAIVVAEAGRLPLAYGPLVSGVVAAVYPQIESLVDAKIAALLA